ncbi:Retrovirus-related Pol polyprotein from transposon 412 [Labeo rohita]|uniref:Gypsy retrotransposon integrase-like protein 1 n=1 Tax=Labeo rohita TaxID=84645 RepID=A0A498NUB1_LABRO|nr:Retrovirus-related Pol polyprotein from transposon 412 [Labeo rohita]
MMSDVFSMHPQDFGCTDKVKHRINLADETPFKHRARPIHPDDREAVKKHLQELLNAGIIRESESPFSSPIVVVRKKNGDVRLCIDYRKLNQQTIKDAYALPKLEDTFMALTGSQWFSVLDLKSGYYQIEVAEADKEKTAFVCPFGFYEFNRMPQGVTNAPSTFQRIMEKCMADINLKEVLVFIDDIIVFSKSLEEHEQRLIRVLTRLREYGLKLAPEKCVFAQTSVKYLGHIVSAQGVTTDPAKVEAVKTWPIPKTLKELRSFLGFIGYYRRFIKDFSKKVRPLNELTSGYPPAQKLRKVKNDGYRNPKDHFGSRWTTACQEAFALIIKELTTAPILAFADPDLPYILHTDASTTGLGAALYQEQHGKLRVIAYASRGLSKSESRYPAHKLEFLALKWAVVEKFNDYLYGSQFTVMTDSNPLTYVLSTAKLDATGYRWLSALSTYNFKLQYRSGKQNMDADGLSRRPHSNHVNEAFSQKEQDRILKFVEKHLMSSGEQEVSHEAVQAICDSCLMRCSEPSENLPIAFVCSLAMHGNAVPDVYAQEEQCGGLPVIPHLSQSEIQSAQLSDPSIREVITSIRTGESPSPTARNVLPRLPYLLREKERLELHNGVLYRRRNTAERVTYQLVLPEKFHEDVFKQLHDDLGHMGIERTLDMVRSRFYWPKMASDVEHKVRTCGRCIRRKTLPEKAAPLVNITSVRPLQLVCMDFLTLEPDKSNVKDILVITDHFTKYALAIPTPNQKAKTVARCLWENFISHYGYPERLHSDQGPDFESHLIKELCELAGIRKVRTTPYHPRSNPVERFNRTLLSMLGTLETKKKSKWKDYVKPLVHAYNCTRNETTGFSPYELMFGRQPKLPVDLAFGLPLRDKEEISHYQYVKTLRSNLEESFRIASEHAKKMAGRNKARFDKRVTVSQLHKGDRVLVRNVRLRGKNKLADKWEGVVYVVESQSGDLPVFKVRPETQAGPIRTLHRDLLLPCGDLPSEVDHPVTQGSFPKRKTRKRRGNETSTEGAEFQDSEEDEVYCLRPMFEMDEPFVPQKSFMEEFNIMDEDTPNTGLMVNQGSADVSPEAFAAVDNLPIGDLVFANGLPEREPAARDNSPVSSEALPVEGKNPPVIVLKRTN